MKTYRAHCALFYTQNEESECTEVGTHQVHLKTDVDAALAAKDAAIAQLRQNIGDLIGENNDYMERCQEKDARIAELEKALRFIEPHRKWLEACSEALYKRVLYTESNTCDEAAAAIGSALIALNEPSMPHPDRQRSE